MHTKMHKTHKKNEQKNPETKLSKDETIKTKDAQKLLNPEKIKTKLKLPKIEAKKANISARINTDPEKKCGCLLKEVPGSRNLCKLMKDEQNNSLKKVPKKTQKKTPEPKKPLERNSKQKHTTKIDDLSLPVLISASKAIRTNDRSKTGYKSLIKSIEQEDVQKKEDPDFDSPEEKGERKSLPDEFFVDDPYAESDEEGKKSNTSEEFLDELSEEQLQAWAQSVTEAAAAQGRTFRPNC